MDRSITLLHEQYNKTYPDKRVSASTFYSLRPKHVHTRKQAKYNSCLCEYCENILLKSCVLATHLPEHKHHFRIVYSSSNRTLCAKAPDASFHQRHCLQRNCNKCGVKKSDKLIIRSEMMNKEVEWKRWEVIETTCHTKSKSKKVKKRTLVVKQGTVTDLINPNSLDNKGSWRIFIVQ